LAGGPSLDMKTVLKDPVAGGKNLGDHWNFELQETQHFYREPYFVLPNQTYRTSSTSIAVDKLSYASPGEGIEQEVECKAFTDNILS